MKKITKKITTEEFKSGELIKRVIEETTEEINDDRLGQPITLPTNIGDSTPPWDKKIPRSWCSTLDNQNIALL